MIALTMLGTSRKAPTGTGSKAAESALVQLLDNHADFDPAIRNELVLLCRELRHFLSTGVSKFLQQLVDERKRTAEPGDPEVVRAQQTIEFLWSFSVRTVGAASLPRCSRECLIDISTYGCILWAAAHYSGYCRLT